MYFFFILFFVSLLAIIVMIGRKFLLLKNASGEEALQAGSTFISGVVNFDKIKHTTTENLKKMEHNLIWTIVKTYLLSKNFINKKRKEIAEKIKKKLNKRFHKNNIQEEKKEISGYIKIISEYRQKIKHIKHKIKEEEGIE